MQLISKLVDNYGNTYTINVFTEEDGSFSAELKEESGKTAGRWCWSLGDFVSGMSGYLYLDFGQGWLVTGSPAALAELQSKLYDVFRDTFPKAKPKNIRAAVSRVMRGKQPMLGRGRPARPASTFDNGWWSVTTKARPAVPERKVVLP